MKRGEIKQTIIKESNELERYSWVKFLNPENKNKTRTFGILWKQFFIAILIHLKS